MTVLTTGSDIAPRLLSYLRDALQNAGIQYAAAPAQITGGFDTSIYAFRLSGAPADWSEELILRVFRDQETSWRPGDGAQLARFEATVHGAVSALNYPVPRVRALCTDRSQLGGAFIVMDRLAGRTMLAECLGPRVLSMPGALARAHAALHELNPAGLAEAFDADEWMSAWTSLDEELACKQRQITLLRLQGLQPGIEWIARHRPPDPEHAVICHGDFHPLNIMMQNGAVTGVIDWSSARIADPAYDVGATIALFTQGPVDLPGALAPLIGWARRRLIGGYYRTYAKERPIDRGAVRYYEALRSLGFLIEAGEATVARAPGTDVAAGPFAAPATARSLITRFRQITGVTLSLPPPDGMNTMS